MQSKDNDTVQSLLREIRDEIKALRKKVLPPPFKR